MTEVALKPRRVTTSRIPMEYDSEGYPLCRQCKTSIRHGKRPKQRTFCGPDCVHVWMLRSDPSYQAKHVLERDKGVCVLCGVDCVALLADLKATAVRELRADKLYKNELDLMAPKWAYLHPHRFPEFHARCETLKLPESYRELKRRLWEMDHTIPVVEGGGSCGLENLRTLCWACHRAETAALAGRRAAARKGAA